MSDKLQNTIGPLRQNIAEKPDDKDAQNELASALFNKAMDLSEEGKYEEADKLILELIDFADENYKNPDVLFYYGRAILNAMPIYFGRSSQTDLKGKINHLRELVIKTQNEPLREILAMILVNAIYDFSLSNQTPSINEFSLELSDLSRTNPKNNKIQIAGAKGMMNTVLYFLAKNDHVASLRHFKNLMKIIEANPREEMVDSRKLLQLKEYFKYQKKE